MLHAEEDEVFGRRDELPRLPFVIELSGCPRSPADGIDQAPDRDAPHPGGYVTGTGVLVRAAPDGDERVLQHLVDDRGVRATTRKSQKQPWGMTSVEDLDRIR